MESAASAPGPHPADMRKPVTKEDQVHFTVVQHQRMLDYPNPKMHFNFTWMK